MFRSILFSLVLFVGSALYGQPQTPSTYPNLPPRPHTPQEVLLLFAGDTADERILLTLNNNRADVLTTAISMFTESGVETVLDPIAMVPNESKLVELSPILQNAHLGHQILGWVKLSYSGINMEMGAQLTLYPPGSVTGVDSPRSLSSDYKSTARSAVFWLPAGGHANLALTNAGLTDITVIESCGVERESFTVAPGTTKSQALHAGAIRTLQTAGTVLACDIAYEGPVSALRVVGMVHAPGDYAAPIRFYDPKTATFRSLTAVGLRSNARSHVTVHNTTAEPVEFVPIVREATMSAPATELLPAIVLPPHGWLELPFEEVMRNFADRSMPLVTLTLKSEAEKGALVGAVTQIGEDNIVEDIPLRTSNPPAFARGSYPLRWDDDYTNMVTVTNTADRELRFGGSITAGDMVYVLKREPIAAGATIVVDVDKLKREHVPDVNGKTIPDSAVYGKIHWIEMGNGKNAGLLGRTSLSSVRNRRRSSFSCGGTCSFNYFIDPFFDPYLQGAGLHVGQSEVHSISQYTSPTNGSPYSYPEDYSGQVTSSDSSLMSVGPSDASYYSLVLNGISPGTGTLNYSRVELDYVYVPDEEQCDENTNISYETPPFAVVPTVSISGPDYVAVAATGATGAVNTITLTATGAPSGGTYTWTSNNSNVSLSNANSATVTVQASAEGTSDVTVTYTLNGQNDTADQTVTVQKPTSLLANDQGNQPAPCRNSSGGVAYAGVEDYVNYQIEDGSSSAITIPVPIYETFATITNSCGATPTPMPSITSPAPAANGKIPDHLKLCAPACLPSDSIGNPLGSCTLTTRHQWYANGFAVFDHTLTYTCTAITP